VFIKPKTISPNGLEPFFYVFFGRRHTLILRTFSVIATLFYDLNTV